jgi:luciferase family oxidoreductase group 1
MKSVQLAPLSVLDLVPITEGSTPAAALRNARSLARHCEAAGYHRYWVAEHHNLLDIASAATAVVIADLAGATKTIRVGSGGIMLPNHAPLVIAEQFGTLESLYPGRIDLGLGRAPGTDGITMRALRRDARTSADSFPQQVDELAAYFQRPEPGQALVATPGADLSVPIWLLGSSIYSAQLAAQRGLRYAFAAHFAPDLMEEALAIYRGHFQPSSSLQEPYAMVCANAVVADSGDDARYIATTQQQKFLNLIRGKRTLLPPPRSDMSQVWSEIEREHVEHMLRESIVGDVAIARKGLRDLQARTDANEIMINSWIFDHQTRLRSYELVAQAWTLEQ